MPVKIDLRRKELRSIKDRYCLNGLPVLGRGAFGVVFDNGSSVIKLMADPMAYAAYFDELLVNSPHFSRVVSDFGIVGKCGSDYYYMLELEKLEPIEKHPRVYADIWPLIERFNETRDPKRWRKVWTSDYQFLIDQIATGRYTKSLSDFLKRLSSFVRHFDATLDLHVGNFMIRPGNEPEIVFADPVFDEALLAE